MAKRNLVGAILGEVNSKADETPKRKQGRPKDQNIEKENRVPITISVPDDLLQEIKIAAVQNRTTQRAIIIEAIRDWLNK